MPLLMDFYFLVVYVSATDSLGVQGKRVSQQAVTGLEVRKSYIYHVPDIILARGVLTEYIQSSKDEDKVYQKIFRDNEVDD